MPLGRPARVSESEASQESRYVIHRHEGRSLCDGCAPAPGVPDKAVYTLWLTAAEAQQRGWTHCEQCGRPFTPVENAPDV
jgi:hypothetical protein